jgi:glycosyltransferase involved in cell wall biosynthesis
MHKPPSASGKPRALFLAPEAPYPARGGGPLRSASLLEYLARRFAVHLIVFCQPGDPDPAQAIPPDRVVKLPHHSKHPVARALRNWWRLLRNVPPLMDRFAGFEDRIAELVAGNTYEYAVIEHFWCAPYIETLRGCSRHAILDLHNIESQWHRSLAAAEGPARAAILNRFASVSAALERKWLPKFDSLLVTSSEDAQLVQRISQNAIPTIYPNALPWIPPPVRRKRCEIAFSGNLEYAPNVAAVRFFREQIWPVLRSQHDVTWRIIGKNPEAIRGMIRGDPRIEVTGAVDDAVRELAAAQVAVAPLLAGSGTRVKIVEAWAAGTPVVSTTIGAQGLAYCENEHLLLADNAERFAAAVSKLLDSPRERTRIANAGRRLFEDRYSWPQAWKALDISLGEHRANAAN